MQKKIFPAAVLAGIFAGMLAGAASAADPVESKAPWSQRMADSILVRQPKGIMIEGRTANPVPKWSYSVAFAVRSVAEVGVATKAAGKPGADKYINYAKDYMSNFINDQGVIDPRYYKVDEYQLDSIAPGQTILLLAHETGEEEYRKAAVNLAKQLETQPRVPEGGFWHKKIYPNQMWLDGIFMDGPFMARLAVETTEKKYVDDIANQILLLAAHAQDPATGLCYHAWDSSKAERWADPKTGLSKNFWGRGMGWYLAGIVETLDYLPENHPKRTEIIQVLQKAAAGVEKVQDAKTGLWYQVLDQGDRAGNYFESSASCMFVYVLAKAARKGYVDTHFRDVAKKGHDGILAKMIEVEAGTGLVTLKDTCQVAGLGGSPYRDGTYEYYLREPRVSNDPKGMAPFILASLELERPVP
ncbi:MAG TPA: glycoside hydrolase family 88 protein [Phycisphaerae bacterium]|nr:glycoside hydrolase family 88 protein [Phycisphaerae bacterium]